MIRTVALFVGAAWLTKKCLDARDRQDWAGQSAQDAGVTVGHVPADLMGDTHPDGSTRAEEHYRPDPTGPVDPDDRESLRPVTAPAPRDAGSV